MLYGLLKIYARFAIRIFCPRLLLKKPEMVKASGPLLWAANHPNSFLDGIILTTILDNPVYSLARGDVFQKPAINRFLRSIKLLPVYRTSEGVENLEHNYTTFASCQEVFRENGMVLIFSEGRCENEWHLRPLKKGTARLAVSSWKQGIPLQVVPLAYNYSSFKKFGKEVHLIAGDPISFDQIDQTQNEGRQLQQFNALLDGQLQNMVYEIPPGDRKERSRYFNLQMDLLTWLLALPALVGVLLHAPIVLPATVFTIGFFKKSGHFDSVQTALLVILYPLFLLALFLFLFQYSTLWAFASLFISPFTAWAATKVKYKLDS